VNVAAVLRLASTFQERSLPEQNEYQQHLEVKI